MNPQARGSAWGVSRARGASVVVVVGHNRPRAEAVACDIILGNYAALILAEYAALILAGDDIATLAPYDVAPQPSPSGRAS
jgi:hypothetical protein